MLGAQAGVGILRLNRAPSTPGYRASAHGGEASDSGSRGGAVTRADMAAVARGSRAVPRQRGRRVAVAAQAEIVEAGFSAHTDFRTVAAVTADAGIRAGLVAEVMVAQDAVDRPMPVMWEVERRGFCAAAEGCAQRESYVGAQQRHYRESGNAGADQDEP